MDPKYPTQKFCKEAHRKLFHRYGTLPYDKLLHQLERKLTEVVTKAALEQLKELSRRVAAAEERLRIIEGQFL